MAGARSAAERRRHLRLFHPSRPGHQHPLRRAVAARRPSHGGPARASGDAALVGAHARHHGDDARRRAGGNAAHADVPHAVTMAGPVRTVAVIDVGKTNAKAVLVDIASGVESELRMTPTIVRQVGPYPHIDVALTWDFLCDALAGLQRETAIDAISIT